MDVGTQHSQANVIYSGFVHQCMLYLCPEQKEKHLSKGAAYHKHYYTTSPMADRDAGNSWFAVSEQLDQDEIVTYTEQ